MHRTFFRKLHQPLQQLLLLQRVAQSNASEQLRCEVWNTRKFEIFVGGKGITNLNRTMVMQTNNVAWERLFDLLAIAGHKRQCIGNSHVFANPHVLHFHAFFILTRHYPHKRHTVTVFGVHIRLNLKHEARKISILGGNLCTFTGVAPQWRWCPLNQAVQHMVDAKIAQRRTKKYRRQFTGQKHFQIKLVRRATHQLNLLAQLVRPFTNTRIQLWVINTLNGFQLLNSMPLTSAI